MDFGKALAAVKSGGRAARRGWNGTGMFIFLVPGSRFNVNRPPLLGIYPEGTAIDYQAHIGLRTAGGSIATWAPSNSDALAEDWYLLDEQGDEISVRASMDTPQEPGAFDGDTFYGDPDRSTVPTHTWEAKFERWNLTPYGRNLSAS